MTTQTSSASTCVRKSITCMSDSILKNPNALISISRWLLIATGCMWFSFMTSADTRRGRERNKINYEKKKKDFVREGQGEPRTGAACHMWDQGGALASQRLPAELSDPSGPRGSWQAALPLSCRLSHWGCSQLSPLTHTGRASRASRLLKLAALKNSTHDFGVASSFLTSVLVGP